MRRSFPAVVLVAAIVGLPVPAQAAPSLPVIVVLSEPGASPAAHARANGVTATRIYSSAIRGWAGVVPAERVDALRAQPGVSSVEVDAPVTPATTQADPPWGLDRIDQRAQPLGSTYTYNHSGVGVTAYIIDSGVRLSHGEFAGRAVSGVDMVDGGTADDCSGHGTSVAGVVGGAITGVAKGARLVSVRVLPCAGPAEVSTVIAGIDWVTAHHVSGDPAVATLSLAAPASSALDAAVEGSIADGITYAVAAGNGDALTPAQDACGVSPARVPGALTVGATGRDDARLATSNFGACLDLFAPGDDIASASQVSDDALASASGTSIAAAHVAGVAALYLQGRTAASPAFVASAVRAHATKGIVTGALSPNDDLLFTTSLPAVTAEAATLDFGERRPGSVSEPQAVLLTNTGDAPLTIGDAVLDGPNVTRFAMTTDTCSGSSLSPGESCAFAARFTPDALGSYSAALSIPSDADGSPDTLVLRGRGVIPEGTLDVARLAFGTQQTGVPGTTTRTVTLQNTGSGTLTVAATSVTGDGAADFVLSADGCASTRLDPGASCAVTVRFTPSIDGDRRATLTFETDAPNTPHLVALDGFGFTPTPGLTVSPSSIAFGDTAIGTTSSPRTIFLSSTGPEPVVIGTLSIAGADPTAFRFPSNGCSGRTLPVGTSCTATVAFAPTEQRSFAAEVVVPSDAPGGARTIALTGRGVVPAPDLRFSPPAIGFGAIAVGVTSPTVSASVVNPGTAPLVIGALTLTGTNTADFEIVTNACTGATIAPLNSCPLSVRFTPGTTGSRSARVEVTSNAAGSPHRLALSGTGAVPSMTLTPGSITFATRIIDSTSDPVAITARNSGSATLSIGNVRLAGASPSDFVITLNGCAHRDLAPSATCTMEIAFAPLVVGTRSARLEFPSNAGPAPKFVTLAGVAFADTRAPVSTWRTQTNGLHVGGIHGVVGDAFDDITGIDRVTVTFVDIAGIGPALGRETVVDATVHCSLAPERRGCLFNAMTPLTPGVYDATARARDFVGNTETPGPTVRVIVI